VHDGRANIFLRYSSEANEGRHLLLLFTHYTGLYLFDYAYHCARMSSNKM
jgi:hypothetical protein